MRYSWRSGVGGPVGLSLLGCPWCRPKHHPSVIPANAGIHFDFSFSVRIFSAEAKKAKSRWIPAYAGMTKNEDAYPVAGVGAFFTGTRLHDGNSVLSPTSC